MAVYLGKDKIAGISTSQPVENNNLKLPEVAPGVQQIVSINSDGTQQNLTLGDGLTLLNGVLSSGNVVDIQQFEDQSVSDIREKIIELYATGKQLFVLFKRKSSQMTAVCPHYILNTTDFTISSVNATITLLNSSTRTLFGVVSDAPSNSSIDIDIMGNAQGRINITTNNYINGNYLAHPAPYSNGVTIGVDVNGTTFASPSAIFDMTYILL